VAIMRKRKMISKVVIIELKILRYNYWWKLIATELSKKK
jgi:hypothetical protein